MAHVSLVENLESRTLLSASVFNSAVTRDRAAIHIDLLKFQVDALAGGAKLAVDLTKVKKNIAAGDTSLSAPFATLRSDASALAATLKADRLTDSSTALADESVIKADLAQIVRDKGNASALVTDHANLKTARIQLQNDLIAGLGQRISDRQADETEFSNDTQAIVTASNNDAAASAKLKLAVNKFAADRITVLNKLTADLVKIQTARTKLVNDLTAEENS